MEEAVIYCRVSSWKQATKGGSLAFQVEDCLACCQGLGLSVIGVFSEIGPGDAPKPTDLPARRQAVKLAASKGAFLVCTTQDRFSREMPSRCPYWDYVESGKVIFAWNVGFFGDRHKAPTTRPASAESIV